MDYICPFCNSKLVNVTPGYENLYYCKDCSVILDTKLKSTYIKYDTHKWLRESSMLLCLITVCKPMFVFASKDLFDEEFNLEGCLFIDPAVKNTEVYCVDIKDINFQYLSGLKLIYANGILADNLVEDFKCYVSGNSYFSFPYKYMTSMQFLFHKIMCHSTETSSVGDDLVQAYFSPVLEGTVDSLFHVFGLESPKLESPSQFLTAYTLGNQEPIYGHLGKSPVEVKRRLYTLIKSVFCFTTPEPINTEEGSFESDLVLANPQIAINRPGLWDPRFSKSMLDSLRAMEKTQTSADKRLSKLLAYFYTTYLSDFEFYGLDFKTEYLHTVSTEPDKIIQMFWYKLSVELGGNLDDVYEVPFL